MLRVVLILSVEVVAVVYQLTFVLQRNVRSLHQRVRLHRLGYVHGQL